MPRSFDTAWCSSSIAAWIVTVNYGNESELHCQFFFIPVLDELLSTNDVECCVFRLIQGFFVKFHLLFTSGFLMGWLFLAFCLIGRLFILSSYFKRIWVKLVPTPLLVLKDSVCCQSLRSNDTFCDFCCTFIAAC